MPAKKSTPADVASHQFLANRVESRSVSALVPYARNARTHSDEQIAQIAASIQAFGWTNPILVDEDNGVIAGHGRLAAAKSLGMEAVPCISLAGLSQTQRRALILADNKLALNAGWDFALLRDELAELDLGDFDMALTGFSDEELEQVATWTPDGLKQGHTDPDVAPEAPIEPVSRTGDLWLMGSHRILCGDATSAEDVAALLADARPNLMVTDPPYGVEYDPDWRNRSKRAGSLKAYGASSIGIVDNDDRADWREAWALFPGDVAYVWHGALHATLVAQSLESQCFELRAQVIWAKQHAPISRGHYHWKHEPCWYAVRKGGTGNWQGDRKQTTLWEVSNTNAFGGENKESATGHGTQKPAECMRRPIENNSASGDGVYDPFVGSGTTIIAAEQTGRTCFALEVNPVYVDVSVLRWQAFTGSEATLDGDGRTFEEIKRERAKAKASADERPCGIEAAGLDDAQAKAVVA